MTVPHLTGKWNDLLPNVMPAMSPQNSRPISARAMSNNSSPKKEKKLIKSQSSVMYCSLINNQNINQNNSAAEGMHIKKSNHIAEEVKSPLNDPSFCKIKQLIHKLSRNNVRSLQSLHRSINRARSVPHNKLQKRKIRKLHSLRQINTSNCCNEPGRQWN
eukprot:352983_1